MKPVYYVVGGGVALLALLATQKRAPVLNKQQTVNRDLIVRLAHDLGVPPRVPVTFAWLESRFDPKADGDMQWAEKRPEMYRKLVVDNPALKDNPWRLKSEAWHSYGLFQLLAPYFIKGTENPAILYDPVKNATLGITKIKNLLKVHKGDVNKVRLAFAGALDMSPAVQKPILVHLGDAYSRFRDIA